MPVFAGFGGRIKVGAANLRAHHWSVDWKSEAFDVTTLENFGNSGYLPGLYDADVTFDAFYDSNDNPFVNPPSLTPGSYVNITIFYVKNNLNLAWILTYVLCTSIHSETGVRDVVRYSFTGKLSGYTPTLGSEVNNNAIPPAV